MTTEDDFQRALDLYPRDHNTRLVFADWLQERNDPRAAGYRALGWLRLLPLASTTAPRSAWFASKRRWDGSSNALPEVWFAALAAHLGLAEAHGQFLPPVETCPRREAEDAAALAFAALPAERQTELLAVQPVEK